MQNFSNNTNNKNAIVKTATIASPATIAPVKAAIAATFAPIKTAASIKADKPVKAAKPMQNSENIKLLNSHYAKLNPNARPVFGQPKQQPLNLAGHNARSATQRDHAFITALRSVYAANPFTQSETGADSGNLARAINMQYIQATGINNDFGQPFYTCVKNN